MSEEDDEQPFEGARDADPTSRIPNAADPVKIEKARHKAKLKIDQRAEFWRKTLSTEIGRLVLWEVLENLSTFKTRFAAAPPNGFPCSEATWFNAGEQAAGWRLYDALRKAAFEEVHLMHLENDPYFAEAKKHRS